MTSYWTMPYQNATDIRLVNLGSQAVTATLSAEQQRLRLDQPVDVLPRQLSGGKQHYGRRL